MYQARALVVKLDFRLPERYNGSMPPRRWRALFLDPILTEDTMRIQLLSPHEGEIVRQLPDAQRDHVTGRTPMEDLPHKLDYLNPDVVSLDRTYPLPVRFRWQLSENPAGLYARLHLSLSPDFSKESMLPCQNWAGAAENLLLGTRYYWKVTFHQGEKKAAESDVASFVTESQPPRLIRAEGLSNIRDLGGWTTAEGRVIRQGLFFRGSEMDTHHRLTNHARHVLLDDLGIRTELDLRYSSIGSIHESPLGPSVYYALIPTRPYEEFFLDEHRRSRLDIFALLADPNAYPVYVHCWAGADRTGTVALMLGAILGLDDNTLLREYELTSFAIWGRRTAKSSFFVPLLESLDRYGAPEEPIRTKAVRFLQETGVTEAQMDSIRRILLA